MEKGKFKLINIKKLSDKQIAQKVINLIDKHQSNYNNLYKMWEKHITPFLDKHKKYSAFALTLGTFGWQYIDDSVYICEKIIKNHE